MNTSNNLTAFDDLASSVESVADCIGLYAIPYSAAIGLMLKIFLIIILSSRNLSNDFYKYLTVKTVFDILVNMLGLLYNNSICLKCQRYIRSNSYWYIFFSIFIEVPFLRVFMMASFLCNVYLTYNRTSVFVTRLKYNNIHWVFLSVFTFSFSLALFIPGFFAYKIEPLDFVFWALSPASFLTLSYQLYGILIILFESVIPLFFIIFLNSVLAFKFHQYQKKRITIVLTSTQSSTVKIIVIKTTLIIIIELLDIVVAVLFRAAFFELVEFDEFTRQVINLSRQIVYLLYFINQSIDLFICGFYDQNISTVVTESKIYKMVG